METFVLELIYNDANRLAEVRDGAVTLATYTHNGQGQRVRKTANGGGTTYWAYGEDGKLLFEYNSAATQSAYLWLGDLLVGVATPEGAFAIETDHLGTPRLASNLYGSTAWRWPLLDNAFGDREAHTYDSNDDPDGGGGPGLELNLRFPGQYHDQETGLHYNYFRDYEPTTGRYIESDPIGLDGGLNTYGYAYQSPLRYVDPDGRFAFLPVLCFGGGCQAAGAAFVKACMFVGTAAAAAWGANQVLDDDGEEDQSNVIPFPNSPNCDPNEPEQCADDEGEEEERCRRVKNECISQCSDYSLPTSGSYGEISNFRICIRNCMERQGCFNF